MRVFVYYNLHKQLWSVRALEGERKGRVILHTGSLCLADCFFKVQEAGRQRVLRERCKNVHAGVVGTLVDAFPVRTNWRRVTYDPYKYSTFVFADGLEPLHHAAFALFEERRLVHVPPLA